MSEHADVQIVRDWYATRDRRRLMSADVVHEIAEGFPHGGTYRGQEAAFGPKGFFSLLLADFPDWRADVDRIFGAADLVISLGSYRARAGQGAAGIDVPFVHLWRVRDDKIAWFRNYTDTLLIDRAGQGSAATSDRGPSGSTT